MTMDLVMNLMVVMTVAMNNVASIVLTKKTEHQAVSPFMNAATKNTNPTTKTLENTATMGMPPAVLMSANWSLDGAASMCKTSLRYVLMFAVTESDKLFSENSAMTVISRMVMAVAISAKLSKAGNVMAMHLAGSSVTCLLAEMGFSKRN